LRKVFTEQWVKLFVVTSNHKVKLEILNSSRTKTTFFFIFLLPLTFGF
jgi:hypothetical protein